MVGSFFNVIGSRPRRKCRAADAVLQVLECRELLAGDVVLQWNDILLDAIRVDRTAPPAASRAMAMVQTAVFDSVNSIGNWYQPYAIDLDVAPDASLDAAASQAAHDVLSALFPAQQATFDAALNGILNGIVDGPQETAGVNVGTTVANHILALRAHDGSTDVSNYVSGTNPGDWRPTPNGFAPPLLPQWPGVTPFALNSGSQFRPIAPPDLTSPLYTHDYNEVKEIGSINSTTRTADQTAIAQFWANGPGTSTPPGHWNLIAHTISEDRGLSLKENARLFAVLNIALADAAITSWDAKYEFDLWRPITAIREGTTDGNPNTAADATWTPLLNTPPFPTYTSGHSTFSGAGAAVLAGFFGTDHIAFTVGSETNGVADRAYTSFSGAAWESGVSRIYGGIHYGFDNTAGLASGAAVGIYVNAGFLQERTLATAFITNNRLNVTGTDLSEIIRINRVGSLMNVYSQGRLIGQFKPADFQSIYVDARGGNDVVIIGPQVTKTTYLYGGDGDDQLHGGSGIDNIWGGNGNDLIFGYAGNDVLNGEAGFNTLFGGLGQDTLRGVRGRDILIGGPGRNTILFTNPV